MSDSYGTCVVAAVGAVPLLYLVRRWAEGGQFTKNDIRIDGKVVIITGANTGIGKETALDLAQRGGKVYLACRDAKKSEAARAEIIEKTGNPNVISLTLDLASFESIRNFVKEFKKQEKRLDILINNAGVMAVSRTLTKDGLEMQIGTNHFGHFLLTNLLLDLLKASAPSRIVTVSSLAHKFGKINREDINSEKSYSKWDAYGQSKLANILFTRELSKRLAGTGVVANSLHPGAVRTELGRYINVVFNILFTPFRLLFKSPKSGAQTTLAVALDPEHEKTTGKYFSDCRIINETKAAQCDETADWLWKKSEEVTGLAEKQK